MSKKKKRGGDKEDGPTKKTEDRSIERVVPGRESFPEVVEAVDVDRERYEVGTESFPNPIEETEETTLKGKAKVQARLAYYLVYTLAGMIACHYILTTWIVLNSSETAFEEHYKPIGQIFTTLLPILSGLVSSAITFYFTREIQSDKQEPGKPE
jgi:hypothetical protein